MTEKLKEVSDEEGKKNLKSNFQRALDFGNRAGLQDVYDEHKKEKTTSRVSRLICEVLEEMLGI
jgi:hypothetical protein